MKSALQNWIVIGACFAAAPAQAAAVSLTSSNRDTTIFKAGTTNSAGGQTQMYVGTNGNSGSADRGLVSFDLSGIPSTAIVQSVQLNLTLSQVAGGGQGGADPTPRELDLHLLSAGWGEGTVSTGGGQGSAANSGDATWSDRSFSSTSPVAWTTAGGDFSASISGAQLINNVVNTTFTWDSTATTLNGGSTTLANSNPVNNSQMVSDVQGWVSHPATNFGWILINTEEIAAKTFRAFFAREASTMKPSLTITYVPEPNSFAIMLVGSLGFGVLIWRRKGKGNGSRSF